MFGEEVEGEGVERGRAGIRMMVLTWIWADGISWTGLSPLTWGEERAVSASDTLSADSG